ncbi:hypothetical protein GW17_00016609 [Ensete ventricosum]|nr:hypothetical protein GW17_00016609 [Ensete ventricosum]
MLQPCAGCFQLGAYMEGMMMGTDLDSFVMLLLSFFFKVDFNRLEISSCTARDGGTYRSVSLLLRGPPATGGYRQKSIVGGRLREKSIVGGRLREIEGRRKREEEEEEEKKHNLYRRRLQVVYALPSPTSLPRVVVARTRGRFFSHARRKIEATAISAWFDAREWFNSLCKRVMEQDWSWNRPALDYMELYHSARK